MVPPDSDRAPPTPPYSGYRLGWQPFQVRGCHPLRPAFPGVFLYDRFFHVACPTTPRAPRRPRFGLAPFRSPLLGGSLLFSSPPPTWMFRFGGFAPTLRGCRALARRVSPFGHPRIHGCSRLPAEYRRLPRPSSPPGATGIPRAPSLACRSCLVIARLLDYYYSIARFCVFLLGDARAPPPLGHPSRGTSVLFVSSFLPSCQRTGRAMRVVSGECGARTHDPRLAKPVL